MGNTWIINMTHYLDPEGNIPPLPGRALRLAEYFGAIVSATTAGASGVSGNSGVSCRRRPKTKPCPGTILSVLEEDCAEIQWWCPCCDDRGVIRGWEGTVWDRSEKTLGVKRHGAGNPLRMGPRAYSVNRSVAVVKPTQVFLDWLNALPDSIEIFTLQDLRSDCMTFLLPEYGDDAEAETVLKRVYREIFEMELQGWDLNEEHWPTNRDYANFRKWFDVEQHSEAIDFSGETIRKEDYWA